MAEAQAPAPVLSVVIPARNEGDNLAELIPEVAAAAAGVPYEVVVANDGSSDDTSGVIVRLTARGLPVREVAHARSLGQSAALHSGVRAARGAFILTLDGDGQNDPGPIAEFLARLADPAVGLVAGQRVGRKATFAKTYGSRLANVVRRGLLKDATRDTGCGIKAFRREAFLGLPYFDTMHRFLPALFLGDGWKVAQIDVIDRDRRHGRSNYGNIDRLIVGISDLFGVWWLLRRRRRNPQSAERRPQ
jgi:dolichol-phosphate mannosyltransferase